MAICLRASEGNLATMESSEGMGLEIKVKSASIPDKETFFNTNQQQNCYPVLNQANRSIATRSSAPVMRLAEETKTFHAASASCQ